MTSKHILTAASGFGLRVVPKAAPYRYTLGPSPSEVDVETQVDDSWLFARVVAADGGYRSQLGPTTPTLAAVADVENGPAFDEWWLETSVYRVPMIDHWTAASTDGPCAFDLLGPDDSLIFVQTPRRLPPLAEIRASGQELDCSGSDSRSEWVQLRYLVDGAPWSQRHHVVRLGAVVAVISAQAPQEHMVTTTSAQRRLVDAIVSA
jgi:hypothetical protein